MARELKVGDAAPDFKAVAVGEDYGDNHEVSLAIFRGNRSSSISIRRTTRPVARHKLADYAMRGTGSRVAQPFSA